MFIYIFFNSSQGFLFLYIHTNTCHLLSILLTGILTSVCKVKLHCDYSLHFLSNQGCEHASHLLAICMYSVEIYLGPILTFCWGCFLPLSCLIGGSAIWMQVHTVKMILVLLDLHQSCITSYLKPKAFRKTFVCGWVQNSCLP